MSITPKRFTADKIATDCPARIQEIGRKIAERLAKACDQVREANKLFEEEPSKNAENSIELVRRVSDHLAPVEQLFAEANELCDRGGYELFCKRLLPNLDQLLNALLQPPTMEDAE
jgi:hypothetical protein